jgi:precorrin-6B C5,15-methyltransferase / cobalt-precorrin-6B C5,C15-methyltransferase
VVAVKRVTVVGRLGGAPPLLPPATLLVGAERHLSDVDCAAERVVLGPLGPAIERIIAHDGDVVVVASGDPGFFGIVRALREAGITAEVDPAVSSVAAAFARLGLPWDDAMVVSAHGRSLRFAANVCRAHPKVAVLTAPGAGPAELAAALAGVDRTLIVAECLGTPGERVTTLPGEAGAWAEPNVVVVLDPARQGSSEMGSVAGAPPGPGGWALPERAFEHRGSMITKAEVRAWVLARLGPRLGDLVWDVGAGSGSVAVECARFGAAVIAVDRDPVAVSHLAANARGLGVQVVTGEAPECLAALPDPDAVFVGGGGTAVLAACLARQPRRVVVAFAALERVGAAFDALAGAGYAAEGVQLQASRLAPLPDGSHRLAALNPVYVVSGELP